MRFCKAQQVVLDYYLPISYLLMKAQRRQRIKKKRTLKLRKTKTKLKAQKMKKHSVYKIKGTFADNDTAINLVDDAGPEAKNICLAGGPVCPTTEKAAMETNLKSRKKRLNNDGTVNRSSFDLQYFMDNNTEWGSSEQRTDGNTNDWKLDNSKEEAQGEDDNWIQIVPKEKQNVSSPLVIKMLSDDITSINLPQVFKNEQRTELDKETSYDDTFELDATSNKEDACIIVSESIRSKHDIHKLLKYKKEMSPVPSRAVRNNVNRDTGNNKLDISDNNMNNPRRNCRRSVGRNNDTEVHSSFRHDTSQHECNQKTPEVYCIRNMVIVIMKSESRFCFTGKLLVKVLYGTVKIYGYVLNRSAGTTKVYSPRGYSNVTIETGEICPEDNVEQIWTALAAEDLTSESELQTDINNVQPGMVVIMLQNFENNLTLFLETYFQYFKLFPNVKNLCFYSWKDPRRAEVILQANLHLKQYGDFNYKRLITDPYVTASIVEKMLNRWRANEWSCALIAGGQNVGKSTTARHLINNLLSTSKVVLVDVDPGQAECTPPGCISYSVIDEPLMGPNFTHLRSPVYQLFIDDVNVSRCVTRYLEAVKMLIEKLKSCPVLSRLPIVINTMGFTQNLGWDIAIITIKLIRPSIILQITSSKNKNNFNNVLSAEVVNKQECRWTFCDERFMDWNRPCEHDLCVTVSQAEAVGVQTNKLNMVPYQQRELVMMSYLSGIIRDDSDSFQCNARPSLSINEMAPYTAPFSSLCIIPQRLFGVPASHALSIINGNIVALCGIDLTNEPLQKSKSISSLRVLTQRSPLCTCYGFGIIRGVDMEQQEIFINTPLPIAMMQHVNCLAGCIPVPPALLQLNEGAPYVGGKATLPTSREPRRGYFRMRYQKKSSKSQ